MMRYALALLLVILPDSHILTNFELKLFKALQTNAEKAMQLIPKVNITAIDEGGYTFLHWAMFRPHSNNTIEIIDTLLRYKADPNAKNKHNSTPLHFAAYNGNIQAAQLLVEAGADVNAKNGMRITPLRIAIIQNHFNIVILLLKCGATL